MQKVDFFGRMNVSDGDLDFLVTSIEEEIKRRTLGFFGMGVVAGGNITVSTTPHAVDVSPLIAIDYAGELIKIKETKTVSFTDTTGEDNYIVLSYAEEDAAPKTHPDTGVTYYTRKLRGYTLKSKITTPSKEEIILGVVKINEGSIVIDITTRVWANTAQHGHQGNEDGHLLALESCDDNHLNHITEPTGNVIYSGGNITQGTSEYDFKLSMDTIVYYIKGRRYVKEAIIDTILLEAPSASSRIDSIEIDADGVISVVKGTPGSPPVPPAQTSNNKIRLALVFVAKGASGITDSDIDIPLKGILPKQDTITPLGLTVIDRGDGSCDVSFSYGDFEGKISYFQIFGWDELSGRWECLKDNLTK